MEINTGDVPRREEVRDVSEDWKRNYVRVVQGEISRATDERDRPFNEEVDLSFLGDLGSLATSDSNDHDDLDTFPNEEAFNCSAEIMGLCTVVESIWSKRSSAAVLSKKLAETMSQWHLMCLRISTVSRSMSKF